MKGRKPVSSRSAIYVDPHPKSCMDWHLAADLLSSTGRKEEALQAIEKCIAMAGIVYGPSSQFALSARAARDQISEGGPDD